MKGCAEVKRAVEAYFARHRIVAVAGAEDAWPQRIALGAPTKAELAAHAQSLAETIDELLRWADGAPVTLDFAARCAGGAVHDIPTHATVASIEDAASICGRAAKANLARARRRCAALEELLEDASRNDGLRPVEHGLSVECRQAAEPGLQENLRERVQVETQAESAPQLVARILKATDAWADGDFDLLIRAARWFATHDAAGLTPRQVPLAGISSKWLDDSGRQALIEAIVGHSLDLVDRPRSIEFAYLDPEHLAGGGRRFDSYTEGDVCTLPYVPTYAIIVENKDTYLAFPPVEGGICLFGAGWAGLAIAPFLPWLSSIESLYYWGDIDADGYEILDAYRSSGLRVESLLMDMSAYERFEKFGTDVSTGKAPLASREEKPLASLTDDERAVYRLITSPNCPGHRRIEQERIPFSACKR